jgi:diacylglycerol kinase (ATP)
MTTVGVLAHEGKVLGDGLRALRTGLADAGIVDPPWRQVRRSKDAPKQVRELIAAGVDRLLVWGGDGTVRRCIDAIVAAGSTVDVAILPAGTANLLANGLGVPTDFDGALGVALDGCTRLLDLGVINGEHFAVMGGCGVDALMIRGADEAKDRLGRLAYVRAGLRYVNEEAVEARVDVDGSEWFRGPAACVLVGNLGRVFGGVHVLPDAVPDDGRLDVGVITAAGRMDWLRVGLRAVAGRIDASPMVDTTQGKKIRIRLERKRPWELDGGDRPKAKKFDVGVLPSRIPVCVPTS